MAGSIWPEIDRAFQRFLALELIECDVNVERNGADSTFASRLKSISPEPTDSIGSLYPSGWSNNITVDTDATSCTHIVLDEKLLADKELFCDVVTGSVTLYLSEVTYMDAASNPYVLFLDYSNDVIQFLRNEINEGGKSITNFVDDSIGVRGFYFISESPISNLKPASTKSSAASDEIHNSSRSNDESSSSTPAVAASLAALTLFGMVAAGFAIQRKKQHLDNPDDTLKELKTPRTEDDMEFAGREEFYDLDVSNDESTYDNLMERLHGCSKKTFFPAEDHYNMNQSRTSECDVPNQPTSEFPTIDDVDETSSQHSANFEYSQAGISMQLRSPDGSVGEYNRTKNKPSPIHIKYNARSPRPDPSVDTNRLDPEPDDSQYPDDESSGVGPSSFSEDPDCTVSDDTLEGTESGENSSTTHTLSVAPSSSTTRSPALNYILSLGSSIMSPPQKPSDESNTSDVKCGSTDAIVSPVQESSTTRMASVTDTAIDDNLYQKRTNFSSTHTSTPENNSQRDASSIDDISPSNLMNWSVIKTPPPPSPFDGDSPNSKELTSSSTNQERVAVPRSSSEDSDESQTEYLKGRRKSLQSRFQNYRRSLSESINNFSDSPAESWAASREFTRSVSLYKNSGQSFSSPNISSTNSILNVGTPSSARVAKMLCELTPATSDNNEGLDVSTEPLPEKRRSRMSKTPRVKKKYTSLNDIEDILDQEESARVASANEDGYNPNTELFPSPEHDYEQQKVDNFLASCGSKTTPEPIQFQPDTVIL